MAESTSELKKVYENVGMPMNQYLILIAFSVVIAVMFILLPVFIPFLQGITGYILMASGLFVPVVILLFPYIRWQNNKREIDGNMHLLISKLGILSTAEMPRKDVIRMISEEKSYGALAEEFKKMWALMEFWNFDLPAATRYIAERTPSEVLFDFLSRMAYSIDAGEPFESFVLKEQEVVMKNYSAKYEGSLDQIDLVKELWSSLTVSFVFLTIFSFFIPLFIRVETTIILSLALLVFVTSEVAILVFVMATMPKDDLWHSMDRRPPSERTARNAIIITGGIGITLAIVASMFISQIQILMIIGVAPLLGAMGIIRKAEAEVEQCDEHFESFLRAVAVMLSTVGGTLLQSIQDLRMQKFGALTKHINTLYKRLYTRIDIKKSWDYFAAESGSNLISQFSRMYVEGVLVGGNTIKISKIISDNIVKIRILRTKRYEKVASMNGLVYALAITSIFTIFLGINVMKMLNGIFDEVSLTGSDGVSLPIYIGKLDIDFANLIGMLIVVVHAVTSGAIIKVMSGRHRYTVFPYMAGLTIAGAGVSYLTDIVMDNLGILGIG